MEFREHDWHDFLTMQTNFNYTLQDARCRRWEKFVAEVTCNDEDKADYLQKALGYSMLGMANEECIKKAYQFLNAQMEDYAQNGKVNPVTAIFLMKNHFGYADKQEVVLTPNQQLGDQVPAEDLEKKYLEDVVGASSDYDSED